MPPCPQGRPHVPPPSAYFEARVREHGFCPNAPAFHDSPGNDEAQKRLKDSNHYHCCKFHGRLQLHGSQETRPSQPTAVTDFKSVAGKREGLLVRDHPMTQNYDRVTLVIDDTGHTKMR